MVASTTPLHPRRVAGKLRWPWIAFGAVCNRPGGRRDRRRL